VFARFAWLRGYNMLYVTSTKTKAREEEITLHQICDKYCKLHEEI
jgi:methionyl-tRNA synthetase